MKSNKLVRMISLLTALLMIFNIVPVSALAAEAEMGSWHVSDTVLVGKDDIPQSEMTFHVQYVVRGNYTSNEESLLVKKEEKISDEESGEELVLTDANGDTIDIETVGVSSAFDLPKTVDRFEPANVYNGMQFHQNPRRRFQSFEGSFIAGNGARMLGYRMVEYAFLSGQKLYLLGDAYMNAGTLTFGKPTEKGKQFIVTAKSEEELVSTKQSSQKMSLIGGIACAVIGLILMISGFTKL